ncbi:hypothetical protein D3C72_2328490 [compost metagenome]
MELVDGGAQIAQVVRQHGFLGLVQAGEIARHGQGQQQGHDAEHHQQLDQGKAARPRGAVMGSHGSP